MLDTRSSETINPHALHPHPYNDRIYGHEESIEDLKEKIAASGWIKPLVVTQHNTIISGHRRWRAALALNLDAVPVERRIFANETDEVEALLLENHSREKTVEQKVREGETWKQIETERARQVSLANLQQGQRKPEVENFPPREPGKTRDKVAEKVGFGSGRTYEKAATVVATADKLKEVGRVDESKALLKVLNEKSVDAAAQVLKLPQSRQVAALEKLATGEAEDLKEALALERHEHVEEPPKLLVMPSSVQLYHGDFYEEVKKLADGSIDLILTDPPYNIANDRVFTFDNRSPISQDFGEWDKYEEDEFIALFDTWTREWARLLRPKGSGYVFTSELYNSFLRRSLVNAGLHYKAMIDWCKTNPGPQIVKTNFRSSVERIIFFTKGQGGHTFNWQGENEMRSWIELPICQGNERLTDERGHTLHPTQKPLKLLEHFIKISSNPGDTVFDGFCGVGSTAAACLKLSRRFIGIEQDATFFQAMQRRLA